jgi:hypothetical protein
MAASDEVPPHHDVLGEGLAAEDDHLAAGRASQMEAAPTVAQVEQLINSDRGRFGDDRAGHRENAVFEALIEGKRHIRARIQSQLCATKR